MYQIAEVDGAEFAETLENLNAMVPEWPPLTDRHLTDGYWWLAFCGGEVVAFAGMVPFGLPGVGYLKRCLVLHRGHGLQYRLMVARELKAKQLGWTMLVSDCHQDNHHSAENFKRAGYTEIWPDQPWYPLSRFWVKQL